MNDDTKIYTRDNKFYQVVGILNDGSLICHQFKLVNFTMSVQNPCQSNTSEEPLLLDLEFLGIFHWDYPHYIKRNDGMLKQDIIKFEDVSGHACLNELRNGEKFLIKIPRHREYHN